MRIFLAGASGVIGRVLVPALVAHGHQVTALTRRTQRTRRLAAEGAQPVVGDVFDADRLRDLVAAAHPDAVIQHLSCLPRDLNPRNVRAAYARNDRVRGQGGANLLAAATAAGARRYIAQNVCFLYAPGPELAGEDAALATGAPGSYGRSVRIHAEMERGIIGNRDLDGLVLRFGFWYGPGTSFASDGYTAGQVARRRYPVVGSGAGVFCFVHVEDVAAATIAALEHGTPGVYNVCDDEPAPMREWLPAYARAIGAPSPRRISARLARLLAGGFVVAQATQLRGASNRKAKSELGWKPVHPSWREGFETALD